LIVIAAVARYVLFALRAPRATHLF
jgi:hypothetical protein